MPFPRLNPAEHLLKRLSWDELDPGYLRKLVEIARDEDLSGLGLRTKPETTGDVSTAALPSVRSGSADLVARVPLTVCGLGLLPIIFSAYGGSATAQLRVKDGTMVKPLDVLATLHGDPRTLLQAERVLLNFIQRLSGIATFTHEHVTALGSTRTRLLDTRKTTPGHRMLEKYAVACGGGWNHRLGLFDRVMLKDNHLAVLGYAPGQVHGSEFVDHSSESPALRGKRSMPSSSKSQTVNREPQTENSPADMSAIVARTRQKHPSLPIEIEVDNLEQIPTVLRAGADVVLLDNFTVPQLRRAVKMVGGRIFTEASGGISLKMLPRLGSIGLDFVSTGALVHHSVWADIGLDWKS
ncbi:MAG TPA: nicotinate-nucleotide diphosphorylase [Opitutaceae bacterium]|nr:nicotinate-nucleotide diphosphorylase [Opitutaceae bacterium]